MKFYIDRHGCAKNQVDAEEAAARLEAAGHLAVEAAAEAELLIVNSCGFIEEAKRESLDAVMALRAAYPDKRILLAGCLSQRYAATLAEELPEADGIVGNADLAAVLEAAEEVMAGERPVLVPEAATSIGAVRRSRLYDFPGTAHVKITEGCSNRCSYCAIPLIRGSLRSRPVAEVLGECRDLVGRGIRELVLVGQDLGSYGRDLGAAARPGTDGTGAGRPGGALLPELLSGLAALEGDFRVRVMYVHPDNFPKAILPLMAANPRRILPYLDLPFQHASEGLLRAMNRRGSARAYLDLVAEIRAALPGAVLRSTFLLGFPGESEEDFAALRAFQDEARLDWLGAFTYSREEGTASYSMKNRIAAKVAARRKAAVEEAQERITRERLAAWKGREVEVLVEERVEGEELCLGRAENQAPEVDGLTVLRGVHAPGRVVRARVLAVNGVDFDAVPLE